MGADTSVVTVNAYVLIALALVVFGSIGFKRGVNRELVTFVCVLAALAASSLLAGILAPAANRLYRFIYFVFSGGLGGNNTTEAWNAAKALPDIISTPASLAVFKLVIFMLPVAISYLIGIRMRPPMNAGQRLLGMLMGCVSGFFIAQHFTPILFPSSETRLELATGQASSLMQNTQVVAVLVVIAVVILIAFGLYSSRRVTKK